MKSLMKSKAILLSFQKNWIDLDLFESDKGNIININN